MSPKAHQESGDVLTADRREVQRIASLLKKSTLALKDYHAIGEQLRHLAEDPTVAYRGSGWRRHVADMLGVSEATLNKCLQFSLAYQQEDLPGLEELDLGWSRLTIALAIEDPIQRSQLLQRVKEDNWGERELRKEIQRLKGSRRGGGRPRRKLRSQGVLADVCELIRLTEVWNDFHAVVWSQGQESYARELRQMDEPARENLRRFLTEGVEQLKAMHKQAKDALAVLKALVEEAGPS